MPPTAAEIRDELDRIAASRVFANADRMTAFLRFVVERALAGEGDQLKEYVVGVAVFGRNEDYDPRLDSIVRVEARRLRTKLDEYYAGDGRDDNVIVRIPRGTYVPAFERREPPAAAASLTVATPQVSERHRRARRPGLTALALVVLAAVPLGVLVWRAGVGATVGRATPIVTIGVLPFAEYSADAADARLAARLTDGVTSALARNRALGVASHTSVQPFAGVRRPLTEIAQTLNVELIFEGTVTRDGDRLTIEGRLVDVAKNRKIWVQDFVGTTGEVRALEQDVATAVGRAAEQSRTR